MAFPGQRETPNPWGQKKTENLSPVSEEVKPEEIKPTDNLIPVVDVVLENVPPVIQKEEDVTLKVSEKIEDKGHQEQEDPNKQLQKKSSAFEDIKPNPNVKYKDIENKSSPFLSIIPALIPEGIVRVVEELSKPLKKAYRKVVPAKLKVPKDLENQVADFDPTEGWRRDPEIKNKKKKDNPNARVGNVLDQVTNVNDTPEAMMTALLVACVSFPGDFLKYRIDLESAYAEEKKAYRLKKAQAWRASILKAKKMDEVSGIKQIYGDFALHRAFLIKKYHPEIFDVDGMSLDEKGRVSKENMDIIYNRMESEKQKIFIRYPKVFEEMQNKTLREFTPEESMRFRDYFLIEHNKEVMGNTSKQMVQQYSDEQIALFKQGLALRNWVKLNNRMPIEEELKDLKDSFLGKNWRNIVLTVQGKNQNEAIQSLYGDFTCSIDELRVKYNPSLTKGLARDEKGQLTIDGRDMLNENKSKEEWALKQAGVFEDIKASGMKDLKDSEEQEVRLRMLMLYHPHLLKGLHPDLKESQFAYSKKDRNEFKRRLLREKWIDIYKQAPSKAEFQTLTKNIPMDKEPNVILKALKMGYDKVTAGI